MKLKDHYDALWDQALRRFKDGRFKYDPLTKATTDTRYGTTLLARPSAQVRQTIRKAIEKLKLVAPGQYYYPTSDLHITVLSIISCYPGFSLEQINCDEYCRIIRSAVDLSSPFRIQFRGLTASPSCIMVRGFPENNQLNALRDDLRDKFKLSPLQHSIDKRYPLETAHITAVRFRKPIANKNEFIRIIIDLKKTDFGSCLIDQLELVGNDWYQKKEKTKVLDKFNLNQ